MSLRARVTAMFVATTAGVGLLLIGMVHAYLRLTPVAFQAVIDQVDDAVVIDAAVPVTDEILRFILVTSLTALALLTLLAGVVGWFVAGWVVRPLRTIAAAAGRITAGDTAVRVRAEGGGGEVAEVAGALNTMLDSLAASLAAHQRFAANASHELRSPIAAIQTMADVALSDPDPAAAREALPRIRQVNARNARTVEGLLLLADVQSGRPLNTAAVDVSALCREVAAQHGVPADIAEGVTVQGDAELLRQAVDNLVRNAVLHGAPGTAQLAVDAAGTVTVVNGGAVLTEAEAATLAEPFARSRTGKGHGLGLALVDAIAHAHNASLRVRPRPAGGIEAQLAL